MFFEQFVPVDALGRTVPGTAVAPTMAHVTPSMAPVSVIQGGSAATAHSVSSLKRNINVMYDTCDPFWKGPIPDE